MLNRLIETGYLKSKKHHVRCFAHILNLAARDLLMCIDHLLKQTRVNILFIVASPVRLEEFQKHCEFHNEKYRKPQIDVCTRWNSAFEMLMIALSMKVAINSFVSSKSQGFFPEGEKPLPLQEEEWGQIRLISKVRKWLSKF